MSVFEVVIFGRPQPAPAARPTIAVIEPSADDVKRAEGRDKEREKNGARKAAFGFARALEDAAEETDT